mmetsp:Transcript_3937/g.5364  ORF Transcript_3937/g.5364 Transcript_3937/m.5364 type:complete len:112 (-) Transcript_3937:27-362(-)
MLPHNCEPSSIILDHFSSHSPTIPLKHGDISFPNSSSSTPLLFEHSCISFWIWVECIETPGLLLLESYLSQYLQLYFKDAIFSDTLAHSSSYRTFLSCAEKKIMISLYLPN